MKVLAFAATSSRNSINKQLVSHASRELQKQIPWVEVEFLDLSDFEMPIYSIDREKEGGIPQAAQDFYRKIGQADALLISFAEHNGLYTAAYKNVFDWASRIEMKVFQGRPAVFLATSPGPGGGARVLDIAVQSAPFSGADVLASLSIGSFATFFAEGHLTDSALAGQLSAAVQALSSRLVADLPREAPTLVRRSLP